MLPVVDSYSRWGGSSSGDVVPVNRAGQVNGREGAAMAAAFSRIGSTSAGAFRR